MEYLTLKVAAALLLLFCASVRTHGSWIENKENQFLYKIKPRNRQEASAWKKITGFYDRILNVAQLTFLTRVRPGRSAIVLVHETKLDEFEQWALQRGLSIRNKGHQEGALLEQNNCSISVRSIHTPAEWMDCDAGSGYHCDDRSNCVCDANSALRSCQEDYQCCNGMTCKTSSKQCTCISSIYIPVESTFSNCCSKMGEYWPYYTANFCEFPQPIPPHT